MVEVAANQRELNRRTAAYVAWRADNKELVDEAYRRHATRRARSMRALRRYRERVRDAWLVLRGKAWVE